MSALNGAGDEGEVVVALDVGGTGIKCALVGLADRAVRHAERHPTWAARGPAAVAETICELAEKLAGTARDRGLTPVASGIAVPGVVDEASGTAVWSANVGFRDVPLRDLVAARTGLPAALGHDVRAGGVAEARIGAARGSRHVLFIAIGTGIAAASVVDGRTYSGAHGAAGELGHVVVRPGGPACGCRQAGCLEAIASAGAVARRYAEQAGRDPAGAAEVARLAADGDPVATTVWTEAIDALADGLLIGQAMFDPEIVVLGGGLAEAGGQLLDPLGRMMRAKRTFHRLPRLVPAALGDEAGCLGAALLAADAIPSSGDVSRVQV
ncbi:ROK family protein [Solwaraspora sp. WMMB335]|uniref:ROK family protein n=1 Tax=Solwaraspora sp. WMMB335 TaxID=3404118 RepID=UPI003B957824